MSAERFHVTREADFRSNDLYVVRDENCLEVAAIRDEETANLFAAAPELLEALQNVLGFCATNQGPEASQAIDDARVMLARVRP